MRPGLGIVPCGEADDHDASLEGDDLGRLRVGLAAHGVVDHVRAPASGGFLHGGDDVLAPPVDHHVTAQLPGHDGLLCAADDADDRRPGRLAELHGRAADPSRGGVDEQGLPRFEAGPAVEAEPARLVTDVQGRDLGVVQRLGRGQQRGGVRDRVLGEAAVRQRRVGDDPAAVLGLTADLHARGERERRPDLVVAPAHQDIGEVDVRGAHLQQDLAVTGRGPLHVLEPHHLARLAVLVHLPCLHAVPPRTASDCFV